MKRLKICIAASGGGHLSQLLSLGLVWEGWKVVCVSTGQMVRDKLQAIGRTYIVAECNRQHPLKIIRVMWKCLKIVLREKPDVVLSTGAAPGVLVCFWGKLFGAKIIWVDSIANTEKLSMSGRMIRPFSDLILSQWPDVAAKYENVEFAGAVI